MSTYTELVFAPMLITDVFDIARQSPAWLNTNATKSGIPRHPHVTNTALGNMVSDFISTQPGEPNPGNAIAVGIDTQVVSYQPVPFYGGTKVFELRSQRLNADNAPILVSSLRKSIEKFSWGYKASGARLKRTRIMVPVTTDRESNEVVDWDGMTRLGRELFATSRGSARKSCSPVPAGEVVIPDLTFEPMVITEVFATMKSSTAYYDKVHLKVGPGENLYLSQTHADNSVADIVADQDLPPEPGNCITVTLKTQATFYQPVPFYTAQNFLIFRHEFLNEASGLFLVTSMRDVMKKFSWGYGVSMGRLRKTKIMVPVTSNSEGKTSVDWNGMTQYGQALRLRTENNIHPVLEPVSAI